MINITYANGREEYDLLKKLNERSGSEDEKVAVTVNEILKNVKANGDRAVNEYTIKFDGTLPSKICFSAEELEVFCQKCESDFICSLKRAAESIKEFHVEQKQRSWMQARENGVMLGQRVRGLERVGLYVPGGTAAYPSSVLMNAIPAKIAGVKELVMVTPPMKNGLPNPVIMAAAYISGVDKVYLMGGAQAIAALAYGTETMAKVDKIVGPGNIYVATAKKLVYGAVDIDMIAGPSEILIIADENANPRYLAADMLSQAEHDVLASSILITTDVKIAEETQKQLKVQTEKLERQDIIRQSLQNFGAIIVCDNMQKAVQLANEIAPEHLEVCAENPMEYIGKLDNAGSVFLGDYAPEPLGDYFAGPNHVLPTSGTAKFFSPLSVDSFIKKSSFIYYTEAALKSVASDVINIAETEGLTAHANSIKVRL
ncbi:MAG: histidinol dehydrogenase [Oscillospiraceae bacterium]